MWSMSESALWEELRRRVTKELTLVRREQLWGPEPVLQTGRVAVIGRFKIVRYSFSMDITAMTAGRPIIIWREGYGDYGGPMDRDACIELLKLLTQRQLLDDLADI